jgi:hypothetical protein
MRPLEKVYWFRVLFGIVAALISTGYTVFGKANGIIPTDPLAWYPSLVFNGASIAIIVYLISYYGLKAKFKNVVEKPAKLVTTGIGIFWIAWIVFWVMLYTILA